MKLVITTFCLLALFSQVNAQFDVEKYKEYYNSHRNMQYQELLGEFPAGKFLKSVDYDFLKSEYADSISQAYSLTDYEKQLLNTNGFMVTDRKSFVNFQQAYFDIYFKDLPVYVSADAILHAFHCSFNELMKEIEKYIESGYYLRNGDVYSFRSHFYDDIEENITELAALDTSELYKQIINDLDVYFSTPESFYNDYISSVFEENKQTIEAIMNLIDKETLSEFELFAGTPRKIDFSQFKPRGHYVNKDRYGDDLIKYFKTMMWFGRTDLYITKPLHQDPTYIPTDQDIKRQTILSALIAETITMNGDTSSLYKYYSFIKDFINLFTGAPDHITVDDIAGIMKSMNIKHAAELIDDTKYDTFRAELLKLGNSKQLYSSHILMSDIGMSEQVDPPVIFELFGQRPTIDNYISAQVVYDQILYFGNKIPRMLPSTLDILFALGNDASIQLLQKELEQYKYSSNLASVRYLISTYDTEFWNSSIYSTWLSAIKSLNPPLDRSNLPEFMQTAAWQQKNMNTQLASWIELRHDFLLYAKQSYTDDMICDFPYSYVEPVPDLYARIGIVMEKLERFAKSNNNIIYPRFFTNWIDVCKNLKQLSFKELNGIAPDSLENLFLKKMVNRVFSCPNYLEGWYVDLFYNNLTLLNGIGNFEGAGTEIDSTCLKNEKIVADFHTSPTDEGGAEVGWVMHGGTGPMNLAVVTVKTPAGNYRSYVGAVMSYYETVTEGFERLTNDDWDKIFDNGTIFRPQFTNLYLADKNGGEIEGKVSLQTYSKPNSVEYDFAKTNTLHSAAFPNPFSESVNICFKLPQAATGANVTLEIVDIIGNKVFEKIAMLPSGNYQIVWNGSDLSGKPCPAGSYIYRIKCGEYSASGNIMLKR